MPPAMRDMPSLREPASILPPALDLWMHSRPGSKCDTEAGRDDEEAPQTGFQNPGGQRARPQVVSANRFPRGGCRCRRVLGNAFESNGNENRNHSPVRGDTNLQP